MARGTSLPEREREEDTRGLLAVLAPNQGVSGLPGYFTKIWREKSRGSSLGRFWSISYHIATKDIRRRPARESSCSRKSGLVTHRRHPVYVHPARQQQIPILPLLGGVPKEATSSLIFSSLSHRGDSRRGTGPHAHSTTHS